MPMIEDGQFVMYLLGGAPLMTGQFPFDMFKIDPHHQKWSKVNYERPIVQTLGSRPVFFQDHKKE